MDELNVCICGGGNLGHVMGGYLASHGNNRVSLLTGHPEDWSQPFLLDVYSNDETINSIECRINKVTSSPEEVIPNADVVFICLPGPHIRAMIERIKPFLNSSTIVGSIVSNTGFFFHAHELIQEQPVFGFQRVPFISRIVEYGKHASLLGSKKSLSLCVENFDGETLRGLMENLLSTPVKLLDNFYEVSLSNSNPLLHPSRMYALWKDWSPGIEYERCPLFYAEWTDESSQLLIDMDNELQCLLKHLPVNSANVPTILDYYESVDASSLTRKIRSIQAFQSIPSPMKQVGGKFIPDLNSRYFTEDFECGTFYIRDTARQNAVSTPTIDMICEWYEKIKMTAPL